MQMMNLYHNTRFIKEITSKESAIFNFGRGTYKYKLQNFNPEIFNLYEFITFNNAFLKVKFILKENIAFVLKSIYKTFKSWEPIPPFRIYEIPYVFKIGFHSKKGELKDVNRIAHCACTNVSVSYGGDRFQTFSGTDSPVETNISLTFKEIELITRTEMEEGY